MAGRSISELLDSEYTLREITTFELSMHAVSDILGIGLASRNPNTELNPSPLNPIDSPTRDGRYDVYDSVQEIAGGSVPDAAMNRRAPQKVGTVFYTLPRHTESVHLAWEKLNQFRQIGQPRSVIDSRGQVYIEHQKRTLAQYFSNLLEAQAAAVLRGGFSYDEGADGRLLFRLDSSGSVVVDYQVPAGNKNQLTGTIINASWATASTDIPGHLFQINELSLAQTGMGISHVVCRSQAWQYVVNNDNVQAQHGTSNVPYEILTRDGDGHFTARLKSFPSLVWHIIDYKLKVWDGSAHTQTPIIATDHVHFFPEPNPSWVQYINGLETIKEGIGGPIGDRYGFYPYSYETHDPDGFSLAARHNGMPALYVPKAMFDVDVTP